MTLISGSVNGSVNGPETILGVVPTSLFLAFLLGATVALLVLAVWGPEWPPRRRRRRPGPPPY